MKCTTSPSSSGRCARSWCGACRGDQSREGRESISAGGTLRGRGERTSPQGGPFARGEREYTCCSSILSCDGPPVTTREARTCFAPAAAAAIVRLPVCDLAALARECMRACGNTAEAIGPLREYTHPSRVRLVRSFVTGSV
eukprot:979533-Prorocentrum_minimum.AAC.1